MSKAYLIRAVAFEAERRHRWRCVRRAARALLCALLESRERAARKIIHDYRHLIEK